MKTSATAKFVGTPSRKIGLVAAAIRGRRLTDALNVLEGLNKRATEPVGKVLRSAAANAENNLGARTADLVVESVLVGPGPTLKRFRPRARGSAASIRKRSSHITVVISDGAAVKPAQAKAPATKTAAKPSAAKPEKKS